MNAFLHCADRLMFWLARRLGARKASQLYADIGHDLRQGLYLVGLQLDALIRVAQADDLPMLRGLHGAQRSLVSLEALLGQLIDAARIDADTVTPMLEAVDAAALIRNVVAQHAAAAERARLRLLVMAPPGRYVVADRQMLSRVMSNLLDNAISCSAVGDTVVVALRRSAAGGWRLQVRDAGIGIPRRLQKRIFDDFVQLRPRPGIGRGQGLGLSISRRLVQLMQGEITVRSAPGQGCTMTVTLARAEGSPPSSLLTHEGARRAAPARAIYPA